MLNIACSSAQDMNQRQEDGVPRGRVPAVRICPEFRDLPEYPANLGLLASGPQQHLTTVDEPFQGDFASTHAYHTPDVVAIPRFDQQHLPQTPNSSKPGIPGVLKGMSTSIEPRAAYSELGMTQQRSTEAGRQDTFTYESHAVDILPFQYDTLGPHWEYTEEHGPVCAMSNTASAGPDHK